jgi:hypothetical protein
MHHCLLCRTRDTDDLEQPLNPIMRNPKIYIISVYRKKSILVRKEPMEFISYVDVESALYLAKLDVLEAQKFTLEEASYVVTALSKMLPEFFMINLNPSYHVQKEFGKV